MHLALRALQSIKLPFRPFWGTPGLVCPLVLLICGR